MLYHYLFELSSIGIQVDIEREQFEEERERMLRNAVQQVTNQLEAAYGIIKRHMEGNESYPSENYDWRHSGLYKQCLKRYQSEKAYHASLLPSRRSGKPDSGKVRRDAEEGISIENSQDASSNFNTRKDAEEQ